MLYSCTYMVAVGVKGLSWFLSLQLCNSLHQLPRLFSRLRQRRLAGNCHDISRALQRSCQSTYLLTWKYFMHVFLSIVGRQLHVYIECSMILSVIIFTTHCDTVLFAKWLVFLDLPFSVTKYGEILIWFLAMAEVNTKFSCMKIHYFKRIVSKIIPI